jgi:proline iminopeptidase
MFARTGHILNIEEPALFNETLARFLVLAEVGRWPRRHPAMDLPEQPAVQ